VVAEDYLKNDETIVYNGILNKLKPGQKWNKQDTATYLDSVFTTWPDDIQTLEDELTKYRTNLLKEMRGEQEDIDKKIG
jgi:hypothetical protein